MNLQLIAKFSLLDEDNKNIANVDIGKTIKDEDLQFSLEEQYLELKNKVANQTPHYVVVDFINKEKKENQCLKN
ncbi:hypothetical protein L5F43_03885 [Aliarcobacter butzleri]|uniref:hypothetical protein n=1 Tax=Aliarcobacter butzleri TaxID=28197 RepID=UPI001EDA6476|nr:hypothetical protein [Aliarcobacter butzleri]MCG3705622.1 hypothetical protein [Aliarcobacter butzleri]